MRRKAKVDANHSDIVRVLRQAGYSVQSLAAIGQGCPDLVCGKHGQNWLLELKNGEQCPSQKRLNPEQVKWHQEWRGQVTTLESVEQVIQWINGRENKA